MNNSTKRAIGLVLSIIAIVLSIWGLLKQGEIMNINLNDDDLMTAVEAAKIWGLNESYVKTSLRQSKQKWPEGSYRKFGHTLVVTTAGMEAATGIKDPRKK